MIADAVKPSRVSPFPLPGSAAFDPDRVPELQAAMVRCMGHLGATAKACKLSRTALCKWIKQSPELEETIRDIREEQLDTVCLKLAQLGMAGTGWAVERLLKSKMGRDRGFGEYIEVEHTGNVDITDARFNEIVQVMPIEELRVLADLQDKLDGYRQTPAKTMIAIEHVTRQLDGGNEQ